jgi:hypothetical protein
MTSESNVGQYTPLAFIGKHPVECFIEILRQLPAPWNKLIDMAHAEQQLLRNQIGCKKSPLFPRYEFTSANTLDYAITALEKDGCRSRAASFAVAGCNPGT